MSPKAISYSSILFILGASLSAAQESTFLAPSVYQSNPYDPYDPYNPNPYKPSDEAVKGAINFYTWFLIIAGVITVVAILGCIYCCCYLPNKRARENEQLMLMSMNQPNNAGYGQPNVIPVSNQMMMPPAAGYNPVNTNNNTMQ